MGNYIEWALKYSVDEGYVISQARMFVFNRLKGCTEQWWRKSSYPGYIRSKCFAFLTDEWNVARVNRTGLACTTRFHSAYAAKRCRTRVLRHFPCHTRQPARHVASHPAKIKTWQASVTETSLRHRGADSSTPDDAVNRREKRPRGKAPRLIAEHDTQNRRT